ncbi:fer-1-like protein 4 isoform X2 [Corythoichthys intestinalis]|uniref:fer-1-like protein 4 isoform X2 n=1 Tax=Corythoichthys intestinalis TaxID=161448 RepID=UPI0025A664A3|nr:fer-1-like protein 4 isoform X2 [Corythoichthys intestinalis]
MSVSIIVRKVSNLPGQSPRLVTLSFRGFTQKTKVVHSEGIAYFNESFRWPHYGKVIRHEVLTIRVYNFSKVFSNRLLGKLVVGLEHIVTSGRLVLREPLTDGKHLLTDIYVELDVRYLPLEGAAGGWEGQDFVRVEDEDQSELGSPNEAFEDDESPQLLSRYERELEREARQLGRNLIRDQGGHDEDESDDDSDDDSDDHMDLDMSDIVFTPLMSRCRPLSRHIVAAMPRPQSFQVNVNILEAQQLAGVNINPAVFIRVGEHKKHTATQKSTSCPFYNENFQFEFHETPESLFDKVIEIKVYHRRTLAFLMTHIGTFKMDIATVFRQPEHRFYQKWAPLTDPADTRSGAKGYVKATIGVLMKGEALNAPSLPPSTANTNEDIERNLMLPRGMPSERPWARFRVRVYKAEGLPTMDAGLMAKISKVSERTIFIDPYVQVTFAGQKGETSVANATSCPVWNEEISFIEQFPPLAQRIRIQVLDNSRMGDIALATHFLDLRQISDPTRNGFNPTFGPCWVNLYGSPQNSTLGDVHQALNQGIGEGIFYRGRVLLALSVEIYSSPSAADSSSSPLSKLKGTLSRLGLRKKKEKETSSQSGDESGEAGVEVPEAVTVDVEEIHPLPEGFLGEIEDFLLFASLFEATMMDPSVAGKPMTFELSIGNRGKAVKARTSKKNQSQEELRQSREDLRQSREDLSEEAQVLLESEEELDNEAGPSPEPEIRSLSQPMRPQPTEYDRSFQCIPLQAPLEKHKPCLFIWSQFQDHSFRLYQANWLSKMADRLEIGLDEVERLGRRPRSNVRERLIQVLLELITSCKQFRLFADRRAQFRPNNLDARRKDFIKKNLTIVARRALRARLRVSRRSLKQRLMDVKKLLSKIRHLAKEPQSTIPDVFLWLLSGSKRLAYVRIPAHSVIFSLVEDQRGRDCGRVTTLYMKSPGGSTSEIFAKLEVYLWLGQSKHSKQALSLLPDEFEPIYEESEATHAPAVATALRKMPVSLCCQDSRYFQLRCHLYQARGIMAADADGLSDPFAKVLFSTQCQVTRVSPDTLSPAWCECLLFDRVLLEGTMEDLRHDPPLVIIHIFDYDAVGSPKSLGRAYAEPEFKPVEVLYQKPRLRFFDINLGRAAAGELLATFELIELDYSTFGEPTLPASVDPQELTYLEDRRCYNIPEGVRPVLRNFRIEVLFWGLRELKRVQLFEVERPLVRIECAGRLLESEEMESYKTHANFKELVRFLHVLSCLPANQKLPEQSYLHPPLTLFVMERRAFGRQVLVGTHVVQSLMDYAPPELSEEPEEEEEEQRFKRRRTSPILSKTTVLKSLRKIKLGNLTIKESLIPNNALKLISAPFKKLLNKDELEEDVPENEELDWWSKYYASMEELEKQAAEELERKKEEEERDNDTRRGKSTIDEDEEDVDVVVQVEPPKRKKIATLKLYAGDLESEFRQFQDWLKIFPLHKGQAISEDAEEEEERLMGKYKGSFLVYPMDSDNEDDPKSQITKGIPQNSPLKLLIRIYVVKATNLAPNDPNGKSDPYLVIRIGTQSQDTKDRYIPKQLNPVFGEVFELTVSFPLETEVLIRVMDHDLVGADDLIGETRVDLENRFYTRHRATCGLALYYDADGYNAWRDAKKPSVILSELCKTNGIPPPEYRMTEVKILNKIFKIPPDAVPEELWNKTDRTLEEAEEAEEHAAVSVLRRWDDMSEFLPAAKALVPEHVEVRPLVNQDKPGLPQGYLHMWVDIFPTDVPAPPAVDIKPRLPVQHELRVIIWNTDDVFLDDVNPFTGEPSSDIYVKGWIRGMEGDKQETDVHFNSLTGEGNFNWRFVFRFDYLPTEKEVVYKRKESFFSLEESEFRQPAVLTLQIWDYDRISANDFLGSIELRLSDMVRGAKSASTCTVQMAKDRAGPRASIFRSKKLKGWWPLTRLKTAKDYEREAAQEKDKKNKNKKGKDKWSRLKQEDVQFTDTSGNVHLLMGKVEAEFHLLSLEQADDTPVGRGRKEPEALDKPNRPTTSFTWFVNPMKTFVFLIWKKFKKFIISLFILALLAIFLGMLVYTLPQQITSLLIAG